MSALRRATGADCVALDNSVDPPNGRRPQVQIDGCVQGNLAPACCMVTGGQALTTRPAASSRAFAGGPHIFNLGHGITPDADPGNVARMIDAVRNTAGSPH